MSVGITRSLIVSQRDDFITTKLKKRRDPGGKYHTRTMMYENFYHNTHHVPLKAYYQT